MLGISPVWSRARGGLTALQVFVVSLRGFSFTVVMKAVSQSERKISVLVKAKTTSNENQEMYAHGQLDHDSIVVDRSDVQLLAVLNCFVKKCYEGNQ